MMENDRNGFVIWVKKLKNARSLRKYGNVHYVSKKMHYVILYCDACQCDVVEQKLKSLPYVRRVDKSMRSFLPTSFGDTNV